MQKEITVLKIEIKSSPVVLDREQERYANVVADEERLRDQTTGS